MGADVVEVGGRLICDVASEDDAWDLLTRAVAGEFGQTPVFPVFRSWPTTEITFWIDNEHEVLTAPMMEAMLAYQAGVYRAFLLIKEDTTNLRSLDTENRREYELRVKVGQGCTKLIPDWQALADKFTDAVVGHMNGTEITITVISFALLFAGSSVMRAWLSNRAKKSAEDARNENTRLFLQQQQFATQADVEKTKMLTDALVQVMGTRALIDASDEGKHGVLRAAARMDQTDAAGVSVPPEVAGKMVRNYSPEPERETIEGMFRVARNDADAEGKFRVKLVREGDDLTFFAGIRDALVSGTEREVISEAEWTQTPFWAKVEVLRRRGEITQAIVVQVGQPH
jgi:hypothetical protein